MENLPSDRARPKEELCTLTFYVNADHAKDKLTRRSVTGVLILLNNTPISWYSKRQKTVESTTYYKTSCFQPAFRLVAMLGDNSLHK